MINSKQLLRCNIYFVGVHEFAHLVANLYFTHSNKYSAFTLQLYTVYVIGINLHRYRVRLANFMQFFPLVFSKFRLSVICCSPVFLFVYFNYFFFCVYNLFVCNLYIYILHLLSFSIFVYVWSTYRGWIRWWHIFSVCSLNERKHNNNKLLCSLLYTHTNQHHSIILPLELAIHLIMLSNAVPEIHQNQWMWRVCILIIRNTLLSKHDAKTHRNTKYFHENVRIDIDESSMIFLLRIVNISATRNPQLTAYHWNTQGPTSSTHYRKYKNISTYIWTSYFQPKT